jgi:hypothetical protein
MGQHHTSAIEEDGDKWHIMVPFSLDAPYLTTGEMEDVPSTEIHPEWPGRDENYLTPGVSETPTNTTMVKLLRSELTTLFHDKTAEMIRYDYQKRYRVKWWSLLSMNRFDETLPTLPDGYFQGPYHHNVKDYFNKHFAIYFQPSDSDKMRQVLGASDGIGRYVYRYWLQMHRGRPPFQRHHFLVAPIELSNGYKGRYLVADLPYVLALHKSLVCQLRAAYSPLLPLHAVSRPVWCSRDNNLFRNDYHNEKIPN